MHLFAAFCLSTIIHSASCFTSLMRNGEHRLPLSVANEDTETNPLTNTCSGYSNKKCEGLTLAGPFLVQHEVCHSSTRFVLRNLQDELSDAEKCECFPTDPSRAWAFLHHSTQIPAAQSTYHNNKEASILNVEFEENPGDDPIIRCSFSTPTTSDSVADAELLSVLSRVLVQNLLSQVGQQQTSDRSTNPSHRNTLIVFPNGDKEALSLPREGGSDTNTTFASALFRKYMQETTEIVPMVDQLGRTLGYVPRSLVHKHNLLHRGVGILVAHGDSIYCHRRTSTKRIFPSMYDMFVGGVAIAGEGDNWTTARRELAEELGIHCDAPNELQYLWQCTVCTDYNRCVVDVFRCNVADKNNTPITWQEEEVAWGAWVPQSVVRAAADRSILRCQDWPGQYPKIQSNQHGELLESLPTEHFGDWSDWDFVPDGLLVWEAFLRRSIEEL